MTNGSNPTGIDPDIELATGLDGLFVNHPRTGNPAWRGGAVLELFYPDGHTQQQRSAMISIWEAYFDLFPEKMTHYLENDGRARRRIEGETFPSHFRDTLPTIGEDEWFDGRLYGFVDGTEPGDPTPYAISGSGRWAAESAKRSVVEAYFPSDWVLENAGRFVETLVTWCDWIKPVHGLCGLGLVRDFNSPPYSTHNSLAFPFLRRYPGLDYMDTAQFNLVAREKRGIRSVNWLTVVSDSYLDELGGQSKLVAALKQDTAIVVHNYAGGVVIQAGALPAVGDVNAGRIPQHYRPVADALKTIRFEDYTNKGYFRVPDPLDELDETMKWIKRFD